MPATALGIKVEDSETDIQRRRPMVVNPVNNSKNVPKQNQQSKIVPQLHQTVAVDNDDSKLFQIVSVASGNSQLHPIGSVEKDNKQTYETVLVSQDSHLMLPVSQNIVSISGSKGLPVKKFVIAYDPNPVRYNLCSKRVPP